MSMTANNALKNAINDLISDKCDGATLTIRTGSAPGAGNTATGTVLATLTVPTPAHSASSGGTAAKSGTWEDTSADATGTAGHFRIVGTGGEIMEGTVGATGSGADMELDSTALTAGQDFVITAFTLGSLN